MIEISVDNQFIILYYEPEGDTNWLFDKFKENQTYTVRNSFTLSGDKLYPKQNGIDGIKFILATLENDYYKFDNDILDIKFDLYMHKDMRIKKKYFTVYNNISVFKKIGTLIDNNQKMIIGNAEDDTLPFEEFEKLIKNFPNSTELKHYANARIDLVIKEYFDTKKNSEEVYKKYMNNKVAVKGENILDIFKEYERDKYTKVLEKLEFMLDNESKYNEEHWQTEILQIILLIFPKYIKAFNNVSIKDTDFVRTKYLDIMLVDSNGHIDIIEIKQPFSNKNIVSHNNYRNNHIPLRELSGSIMQVEKYIYNLTRWGERGEEILTKKYNAQLPKNLKIKITNPNGLIIMGREQGLTDIQKKDLEIIKRKYKNVIDVITYDDLIQRLKNIIAV